MAFRDPGIYTGSDLTSSYEFVNKVDAHASPTSAWMLGQEYILPQDKEELREKVTSKLWFTYRKNFRAIGTSNFTSDSGWGCTMRCGQMLLGEALIRRHLPAGWGWHSGCQDEDYHMILRSFLDKPDSLYSIQQIAQFGVDLGRRVGEWFGPNNICHVIKKLTDYDRWSNLTVHVAMDLLVVEEDIREACYQPSSTASLHSEGSSSDVMAGFTAVPTPLQPVAGASTRGSASADDVSSFHPLLLLIPLRLGLEAFEPAYFPCLKATLRLPQSVGFIGGKPRHALWFFGYQDSHLLCLDPHTTQSTLHLGELRHIPDETYHCSRGIARLQFKELDPSVALGFYCGSEEELNDLFSSLRQITPAIFEVLEKSPTSKVLDCCALDDDDDFADIMETPIRDDDDGFEIVGEHEVKRH